MPRNSIWKWRATPALALLLGGACATSDASFSVQRVPGFAVVRPVVSVFGVFREGQMSPKGWEELSPAVSSLLGATECETEFGDRLGSEEPDLYSHIDKTTKDDGVTPELLAELAPRAKGSLLLVIYEFGKPPPSARKKPTSPQQQPGGGGQFGRHGRGSGGGRGGAIAPSQPVDDRAFEMSASLYSVERKEMVMKMEMRYPGSSGDEALKLFTEKLRVLIGGGSCVGWQWRGAPPEPAQL